MKRIPLHSFADIHTHRPSSPQAILSVEPDELCIPSFYESLKKSPTTAAPLQALAVEGAFSLSLHPWRVTEQGIRLFTTLLPRVLESPQLTAIGECGLDPLCTTPMPLQQQAFVTALRAAREAQLPVIIHIVRCYDEMLRCVREVWGAEGARAAHACGCPLVIHGWRKGPQLTRQLLSAGFSFSFGEHRNAESFALVDADRRYEESDAQPDA